MQHSHSSRNYAKAFFAFVTIGLTAACADSIIAPTSEVSFKAPAGFDRQVGVKVFRVDNSAGTTQKLGRHTLAIPAGAICDPASSTYGQGEWDKPCNPLKRTVVITATMMEDDEGRPYVDFQPALRFAPNKEVNLFLRSGKNTNTTTLNIEYCNNAGHCTDESLTDPTLVTRRVGNTAVLVRRIKHFSGYMIVSGEYCPGVVTQEADGTLMCNPSANGQGGNFARRSGYMVASGLGKSKPTRDGGAAIAKKRNDH